jgi:hypothetical protein
MKNAKVDSVRFLPRTGEGPHPEPEVDQARHAPAPRPTPRKGGPSGWTQAVLVLVLVSMLAGMFV